MMHCRICGSTKNLKYTPAEIRGSQKSKRLPLPLKEIANAINGNICKFCDLRLENFHKEASPVEIDITDDEIFCEMFYKRQYGHTEAVATVRSLGSDGDPEVIEVLTSRETTPDIAAQETKHTSRHMVSSNTRIIDVIDLEDDDESTDKGINAVNNPARPIRQENLLGCLSLVTSDSESSEINFEPCHKANVKIENEPPHIVNRVIKNESESSDQIFPVCDVCGIRFLDTATAQAHMKVNHQLPCPVCSLHLETDLELVCHIRKKHRQYNGTKLCQGVQIAQDSAMTIRLRFDQRINFYECQLCGHIDSQFKAHKEHIILNHPDESKSLRDPMMKTKFSCPACHQKIGTHHVDVCRHVLQKHPEKCKKYIKEITDLSSLPIKTTKSLNNIKYAARVLAFIGKEERFYECQLCKKVWGSFQCFSKHLNIHNMDEWTEYEKRKSGANDLLPNDSGAKIRSKRKTEEHKIGNMKQKHINLPKNKIDLESSQKSSQQQTTKKPIPLKEKDTIKSKKQDGLFKKPQKQTLNASWEGASNENKRQKKLKRRSKNDAPPCKGTSKVKVKAPIRHFPTQKYDCKHCQSTFKGFRKLQLHLIKKHNAEEFRRCQHCPYSFTSASLLEQHNLCAHTNNLLVKRKRKLTTHQTERETFDENFNKEPSTKRTRLSQTKAGHKKVQKQNNEVPTEAKDWLKELYQLSWEKKSKANHLSFQTVELSKSDEAELLQPAHNVCRYCARLFTAPAELSIHEKLHKDAKDMPWIAFGALMQV